MKKIIVMGGAAVLALGAITGVALAQQQPAERAQRWAEPVAQADFVNRAVERVERLDANSDGTVTADERRAAMEARRGERMNARFAKLDANSDGSISRAEFDAGHAERGQRMGRRGGGRMERVDRAERTVTVADARARAEQAFTRMDKDGDGVVTREERREMRGERRAHRAARPAPAAE